MSSNEDYLDSLLKSMGKDEIPTVDNIKEFSADEIEQMLTATEQSAEDAAAMETKTEDTESADNDDLLALLGSLSDDEAISEINDLLNKNDNNEIVDPQINADTDMDASEEIADVQEVYKEEIKKARDEKKQEKQRRKQLKKAEKLRKKEGRKQQKETQRLIDELEADTQTTEEPEAPALVTSDISSLLTELEADEDMVTENREEPIIPIDEAFQFMEEEPREEKKKGVFSKLLGALTEEDPEDIISDENQAILDELAAEDRAEDKKKKSKKAKKGKEAKKEQSAEEDEEEEDSRKGAKAKKKPKKAKPKKQKPAKAKPAVYEAPARRISKKSITVVVLFAATVFVIVYFGVNIFSEMLQMKSAKAAFQKQDYVTCYEKMYGMELSEKEKEMFKHAELVLKMQRRIAVYEKYMAEKMELEALDSLMRGVAGYEELYNEAQGYGAGAEVHSYYLEILDILEEKYDLSKEDAIAIAGCESNVQYTRYLTALVEGDRILSGGDVVDENGGLVLPEPAVDDVLPAEDELPQQNFAD